MITTHNSEFSAVLVPSSYIIVFSILLSILLTFLIVKNKNFVIKSVFVISLSIIFFTTLSTFIVPVDVYEAETEIGLEENIESLHISEIGRNSVVFSLEEERPFKIEIIGDYGEITDSIVFDEIDKKTIPIKPSEVENYDVRVLNKNGKTIGNNSFYYNYNHKKISKKGWFHLELHDCTYISRSVENKKCFGKQLLF